jgi:hypothetical protein
MDALEKYTRTVESLRRTVEQHRTPSGAMSQRAFAEAYGYDRENLRRVLAGEQEMSVSLLLRLSATLRGQEPPQLPPGVERWSLRTWLEMQQVDVHGAMYEVNFRDTGIVQNSKKNQNLP